jgi:hypothetical protein
MKFKSQKNTIWVLTNLWMLDQAIEIEEGSITLIALWDGKRGTGDGGTEHMINESRAKGAEIKIININKV